MIVRPITAEELPQAQRMFYTAFGFAMPDTPEEQKPDAHLCHRAAFDEAGHMTACLQFPAYTIRYGAHTVPMWGVGGVASLPETRRQGNIRALFDAGLAQMWEQGVVFSALYPFSHPYYRQYGFELVTTRNLIKVPLADFAGYRGGLGMVCQWMPGQDDAPLRAVYDAFTQGCNLAVVRQDAHWRNLLDVDPYTKRQYTYTWQDDAGTVRAYMVLVVRNQPGGKELFAREIAFTDRDALTGLFGMLRSMDAAYSDFVWAAPEWLHPLRLFPEPYHVECKIDTAGMARVVRVEDALRLCPYPDVPGAFVIGVEDPQLPQNQGAWRVTYGGGSARVERAQEKAVVTLGIPALTELLMGRGDQSGIFDHPDKALLPIKTAFTQQKVLLTEGF